MKRPPNLLLAGLLALGTLGTLQSYLEPPRPSSFALRDSPRDSDFEQSLKKIEKEALSIKGRKPDAAEREDFEKDYPRLKKKRNYKITGDCTSRYNCIAWSVGDSSNWAWPGDTEEDFDAFYEKHGCRPAPAGTPLTKSDIVLWAKDEEPTHACRRLAGKQFESKCGRTWRITHALRDLQGAMYGKPYKGYLCDEESRKNFLAERVSLGPPMSQIEWDLYQECLSHTNDPEDCRP